jgi:hypothetical protein
MTESRPTFRRESWVHSLIKARPKALVRFA